MKQALKNLHQALRRNLPGYYKAYLFLLSCLWSFRSVGRLAPGSILLFLWLKSGRGERGDCHALFLRGQLDPVWVRAKSSDIAVFQQIFFKEEYSQVDLQTPLWIMDAGANIGLASLYFLFSYPTAKLVAIEPSPRNFAIMQKNLAPYAARCTLVQGAVWKESATLSLQFEDVTSSEWAVQVQADAQGCVEAFDMRTLFTTHGIQRLSLLKMDIEGAEESVFAADTNWLRQVEMLAIELHGNAAFATVEGKCRQFFATVRQDREIRIYTGNTDLQPA